MPAGGRKSRALATVKIAVLAPMPIASDRAAVAVNTGLRRSSRSPCAASCHASSIQRNDRASRCCSLTWRRCQGPAGRHAAPRPATGRAPRRCPAAAPGARQSHERDRGPAAAGGAGSTGVRGSDAWARSPEFVPFLLRHSLATPVENISALYWEVKWSRIEGRRSCAAYIPVAFGDNLVLRIGTDSRL